MSVYFINIQSIKHNKIRNFPKFSFVYKNFSCIIFYLGVKKDPNMNAGISDQTSLITLPSIHSVIFLILLPPKRQNLAIGNVTKLIKVFTQNRNSIFNNAKY